MKKFNLIAAIAAVCIFTCSCNKSSTSLSGNVTKKPSGFQSSVALFNGDNTPVPDSLAGITVTAANVESSYIATTDAKGNFKLPVIPNNGMVTVTYTRNGFGAMQDYYTETAYDSIQNGLFLPGSPSLYRISPVVVNSLTGIVNGNELTLTCNVTAPGNDNAVRFAISKSSDVAYNNGKNINNFSRGFLVKNGDNIITLCTPCEQECGFKAGDTLYIKAYGDVFPAITYYNLSDEKIVFPCINANSKSQVVSFVVGK